MKTRASNIEFLRLLAMFLVLGAHANYVALRGAPDWTDFVTNPVPSFFRVFFEQACVVGVNVFILISGWFGIKPKTVKFLSILFQVFFFSIAICILAPLWGETVELRHLVKTFWVGSEYWFVIAYLILFLFSPALNAYCEKASEKELRTFLILFYTFSTCYGFIGHDIGNFHYGYSAISFIGLYVLARYVRIHGGKVFSWKSRTDLSVFLLCVLITTGISILQTRFNRTDLLRQIDYNNPLVILAALYLFLAFSKIKFESKAVNWLAGGAFAIYIIHYHPLVFDHYVALCQQIYQSLSGVSCLLAICAALVVVGLACILLDKVRMAIWKPVAHWVKGLSTRV